MAATILQKLSCTAIVFSTTGTLASYAASPQQLNAGTIKQQIQSNNQPQALMQQQQGNQQQINQQQTNSQPPSNLNAQPTINSSQPSTPEPPAAGASGTYTPPVLRGLNQNNSASMTEEIGGTSPVASFFQMAPQVVPPPEKPKSGTHKFLWHFLDNIGVPMFINHDADIDPSLTRPFVMPPLPHEEVKPTGEPVKAKETIIDPQAAAQDPSTMAPDTK